MNGCTALVPVRKIPANGLVKLRQALRQSLADAAALTPRVWLEPLEPRQLLSAALNALGGNPSITVSFSGYSYAYPVDIAKTPDGGFIVASEVDQAVGDPANSQNPFWSLIKFNSNGQRDPNFAPQAVDGVLTGSPYTMDQMIEQPDGKLLVFGTQDLGDTVIAERFNADGTPDATFNGGQPDQIVSAYGLMHDYSTWLQPDGKIMVTWFDEIAAGNQLIAQRLNSDGTIDRSFGNGGTTSTDIPSGADQPWLLTSAAPMPGGGFSAYMTLMPQPGQNSVDLEERMIFDGAGDLTSSKLIQAPLGNDVNWVGLTAEPDGSAYVYVQGLQTAQTDRFDASGNLDPTFGQGGIVQGFLFENVAPDGKLYAYFEQGDVEGDMRLNADGSIDPTFNNGQPDTNTMLETPLFFDDGSLINAEVTDGPAIELNAINADGSLPQTAINADGSLPQTATPFTGLPAALSQASAAAPTGPAPANLFSSAPESTLLDPDGNQPVFN